MVREDEDGGAFFWALEQADTAGSAPVGRGLFELLRFDFGGDVAGFFAGCPYTEVEQVCGWILLPPAAEEVVVEDRRGGVCCCVASPTQSGMFFSLDAELMYSWIWAELWFKWVLVC